MPWDYTPCKIAWTHSEFWRKILRGSLTAEVQNTIVWLLGVIYSFPKFPIFDLYGSTSGTHDACVLFNHMQLFFHDTQKLTKIRNQDRNENYNYFFRNGDVFPFEPKLISPPPMSQSPPPPAPIPNIPELRACTASRPFPIVLVKCWKVTHWIAKKLLKNCHKSKKLLPKFQKLPPKFLDIFI